MSLPVPGSDFMRRVQQQRVGGDRRGVLEVPDLEAGGQQGLDRGMVLGQVLEEDQGDVSRRCGRRRFLGRRGRQRRLRRTIRGEGAFWLGFWRGLWCGCLLYTSPSPRD